MVNLSTFSRFAAVLALVVAFAAGSYGTDLQWPALYELDDWTECRHLYCMVRVILSPTGEPPTSPNFDTDVVDDQRRFRRTLLDRGVCLRSVDALSGQYRGGKLPHFPTSAWNRSDRYILDRAHFPPTFHANESTERAASVVISRQLAAQYPGLVAYTEIEYCLEQSSSVHNYEQTVAVSLALALAFGFALSWNARGALLRDVRSEASSRKPFLLFDLYKNFAMVGSVLAHCVLFGPFLMPAKNIDFVEQTMTHPNAKLIGLLSPFLMQIFFTMSAMLLTVKLLHGAPKAPLAWSKFGAIVAHRLIRLQPLNLLTIGFCAIAYQHFIGGPLGPRQLIVEQGACRTRWWMNLLFISNFNMHKPCLPHSWYISADFQLFLLIALLLLATLRWPRKTPHLLACAIVASFLGPFLTVLWTDFDPIRPDSLHEMRFFLLDSAYLAQLYTPFYNNLSWSVGGMLAGLVYDRYQRQPSASIVRRVNLAIGVAFLLLLAYGRLTLAASGRISPEDGRCWLAAYYAAFKLSAAVFFSAGTLRTLLTEKDFPGSAIVRMGAKLYYCVYLIHMPVFRIVFSSATAPTEVTPELMVRMGFRVFGISYALAVLLHHGFEKPVMGFLRRVLLHRV
uniref:Acyltransferase 3 domain-containing protein n=1 Tax=Anopheles atroparvus TaxID=41427 RepID=A0AAG5DL15_ANOAO